jgi:hypothetical protein
VMMMGELRKRLRCRRTGKESEKKKELSRTEGG